MTTTLSNHLLIKSPSEVTQAKIWEDLNADFLSAAPPFRFRRSREIASSATALIDKLLDGDANSEWQHRSEVQVVRDMLERTWADGEEFTTRDIWSKAHRFFGKYPLSEHLNDAGEQTTFLHYPTLETGKDDEDGTDGNPVENGTVIAFAPIGDGKERMYFELTTRRASGLSADSFGENPEEYDRVWREVVDGVRRVFPKGSLQPRTSSHHFLDLGVGAVLERFPYLKSQKKLKTLLKDKLQETLKADSALGTDTSYAVFKAVFEEVQSLNGELAKLKRSTSALAGYAASRGYRLMLKPEELKATIRGKPDEKYQAEEGDLYRTHRFITTWTEQVETKHEKKKWYGSKKTWSTWHTAHHKALDVEHEKIESDDRIVTDYIRDQLSGLHVSILRNVAAGLEAEDGRSLAAIMERCDRDPAYQAKCVLLMPVYDQTLFGQDTISGYHVIRRPRRGRRIVGPPVFYIEEQIAYKLRWLGVELGELLTSINLLPGEVRDIAIKTTRSSLTEQEVRTSHKFETDTSSSFDTISSVEQEFQRENTSEKTKAWSVKASGSYGKFSGGGSASGSSRQTARQFARNLNKLTTQAISKMRKNTRSEVVAKELNREELESVSSSSGQIVNPNVGRTLNVNYFAVNNIFVSSTYLDDLGFTYISPFELVEGSEIREVRSYSKEDLNEFLEIVREDLTQMIELAFRYEPKKVDADPAKQSRAIIRAAAEEQAGMIVTSLKKDYCKALCDYSSRDPESKAITEVSPIDAFRLNKADKDEAIPLSEADHSDLEVVIKQLAANGSAIEPDVVISPSGAVYADATIGATEGLESYAVDMRKLEVEKGLAEVVSTLTREKDKSNTSVQTHHNVAHTIKDGKLTITLGGEVSKGKWMYRVGAAVLGTIEVIGERKNYTLTLPDDAPSIELLSQLPGSLVRHD